MFLVDLNRPNTKFKARVLIRGHIREQSIPRSLSAHSLYISVCLQVFCDEPAVKMSRAVDTKINHYLQF